MLSIKLNNDLEQLKKEKFSNAIAHIASSTVARYRGTELRPNGSDEPSFDISQVCCWLCEKPLGNGMRLCHAGGEEITLIRESHTSEEYDAEMSELHTQPDWEDQIEESTESNADPGFEELEDSAYCDLLKTNGADRLLTCGDCAHGLLISIKYFVQTKSDQKLIINPSDSDNYVGDPNNWNNYIWPNRYYWLDLASGEVKSDYNSNWNSDLNHTQAFTSSKCFRYVQDMMIVNQLTESEEDEEENSQSELEQHVFIAPNPGLPEPIRVMAQNTIRLFRLNGIYYDHIGSDLHRASLQGSQIFYDDLRQAGRDKAWDRANTALKQFKSLKDAGVEANLIELLTQQQKILVELNGYRSVWATVFRDGGDSGLCNEILNVPAGPKLDIEMIPDAVMSDQFGSGEWESNKKRLGLLDNADRLFKLVTEISKQIDPGLEWDYHILKAKALSIKVDTTSWIPLEGTGLFRLSPGKKKPIINLLCEALSTPIDDARLERRLKRAMEVQMRLVTKAPGS